MHDQLTPPPPKKNNEELLSYRLVSTLKVLNAFKAAFPNIGIATTKLWSMGAFRDFGAGAGLGNFWKMCVRVWWDSAIKKLLKIFLFIFSI